jgi:hypothetical protein
MVRFDPEYPFKSPAVQFVVSDKVKPPVHPVCSFLSGRALSMFIVASILARLHERPCKRLARLAYDRSLALDIDPRYALLYLAKTGPPP